jgi:diaminopimelate epimerase
MDDALPFVKTTACGNDFLIVDGALVRGPDLAEVTRKICDRHFGVGADGVEWTFPSADADVQIKLLNSDGSDAEISGNGTRCVAAWYAEQHGTKQVRIATGAGIKTCTLIHRDAMEFEFKADMGAPKVDKELAIKLAASRVSGIPVSMGNPHYVMFVDQFKPDWQVEAAKLERHSTFPNGTNVELVKVTGANEIEIRIFERGAGETHSSGTGSCASAIAAISSGRVKSPVRVISPGGPQTVEWEGNVFLTGPARILCRGDFYL